MRSQVCCGEYGDRLVFASKAAVFAVTFKPGAGRSAQVPCVGPAVAGSVAGSSCAPLWLRGGLPDLDAAVEQPCRFGICFPGALVSQQKLPITSLLGHEAPGGNAVATNQAVVLCTEDLGAKAFQQFSGCFLQLPAITRGGIAR